MKSPLTVTNDLKCNPESTLLESYSTLLQKVCFKLPFHVFLKRQYNNSSALRANAFVHVSSLTIQASEA